MRGEIKYYFQIKAWLEGTYTLSIIENFIAIFTAIFPYLVICVLINALAVKYLRRSKAKISERGELFIIIAAALIGIISPLPTYAAIPISVSLMAAGLPLSGVLAFVISSPLINPGIFFLTASQLGIAMAVTRTICALIIGVSGGLISKKIFDAVYVEKHIKQPELNIKPERSFLMEVYRNAVYIGKTFTVSVLISAAVKSLIPASFVFQLFKNNNTGLLAAIALGVPFYNCGGASIPIVQTLMEMGMGKGAVLAFFIAGPATKLETIYAYKKILGLKILIYFFILTFVFAYISGLIYSFL